MLTKHSAVQFLKKLLQINPEGKNIKSEKSD